MITSLLWIVSTKLMFSDEANRKNLELLILSTCGAAWSMKTLSSSALKKKCFTWSKFKVSLLLIKLWRRALSFLLLWSTNERLSAANIKASLILLEFNGATSYSKYKRYDHSTAISTKLLILINLTPLHLVAVMDFTLPLMICKIKHFNWVKNK